LWREENQRSRRKSLEARRRPTINSTHIWFWVGIEQAILMGDKRWTKDF